MHSLYLVLALGATVAWGVPIERRQDDDFFGGGDFSSDLGDIGGGGDTFGGAGNSLIDSGSISLGPGLSDPGFPIADVQPPPDPAPVDPAPVEPPPIVVEVQAPPQVVDVYQPAPDPVPPPTPEVVPPTPETPPPAPVVVADVPPAGLGATDGALIASANLPPDTPPNTPDATVVAPIVPVSDFTPGQANVAAINSLENLDPSKIGSTSTDTGVVASIPPTDPGVGTPPPKDPAPADILSPEGTEGIKADGSVQNTATADTALHPNNDLINNSEPNFTPGGDNTASVPGLTPALGSSGVEVASNEANLGTGSLTLPEFKDATAKLAEDPGLSTSAKDLVEEVGKIPLTAKDFGVLQLNTDFKAGSSETPIADQLSTPATDAIEKLNIPRQPNGSNGGFNFGELAKGLVGTLANIFGNIGAAQNQIAARATVVQRVGVPVTRIVRVGVPVTPTQTPRFVTRTLPGGFITRILVYKPLAVVTSRKTGTSKTRTTSTPRTPSKNTGSVKPTLSSTSPVPVKAGEIPVVGAPAKNEGTPGPDAATLKAQQDAAAAAAAATLKAQQDAEAAATAAATLKAQQDADAAAAAATAAANLKAQQDADAAAAAAAAQALANQQAADAARAALLASPNAAGNPIWNGVICSLFIFGAEYPEDQKVAAGCPTGALDHAFNYQQEDGSIISGSQLDSLPDGYGGYRVVVKGSGTTVSPYTSEMD